MYICEKCESIHDGTYGSSRFCSNFCSHSRILSKESKIKLSKALKGRKVIHPKKECNKCKQLIIAPNFNKHYNVCNGLGPHRSRKKYINKNWLQKNGLCECPYCGLNYNKNGIIQHINKHKKGLNLNHKIIEEIINDYKLFLSMRDVAEKYNIGGEIIKKILKGKTRNYSESSQIAHKRYPEKFKHSLESKEKMRKSRVDFLKKQNNRHKTAWWNNSQGKMSYGEKILHNIFLKNNIYEQYDVVNEYCEFPYFIDFAFINEKIAVEFDGKCHFSNGKERIQHDIKRDELLVENGWKMYRIAYYELNEFNIKDLIKFIGNPLNKKLKSQLEKYSEVKNETNERIKDQIKKRQDQKNKRELSKIERKIEQSKKVYMLLKSDIEFHKHGWVNKASKLVGIRTQKISGWMKEFMPEFYEEKCFKRTTVLF